MGSRLYQDTFFTKGWIAYFLPIRMVCKFKVFVNLGQIRLLNSKNTDLDRYYFTHNQKLKFLTINALYERHPRCDTFRIVATIKRWCIKTKKAFYIGWVPPTCHTVSISVATTRCQYKGGGSAGEHIWTGLQWWRPDAIRMGSWGLGIQEVMSRRTRTGLERALYSKVQCIRVMVT